MIPATVPEQKRGVLEGDSELDRTVILSNAVFTRRQKQSEERTAHLAVGRNTL